MRVVCTRVERRTHATPARSMIGRPRPIKANEYARVARAFVAAGCVVAAADYPGVGSPGGNDTSVAPPPVGHRLSMTTTTAHTTILTDLLENVRPSSAASLLACSRSPSGSAVRTVGWKRISEMSVMPMKLSQLLK